MQAKTHNPSVQDELDAMEYLWQQGEIDWQYELEIIETRNEDQKSCNRLRQAPIRIAEET